MSGGVASRPVLHIAGGILAGVGIGALAAISAPVSVAIAGACASVAAVTGMALLQARGRHHQAFVDLKRNIAAASGGCVWIWQHKAGVPGSCWFSEAWADVFGMVPGDAPTPGPWFDRVHPEDLGAMLGLLERAASGVETSVRHPYRMLRGDSWRWFEVHALRVDEMLVGSVHDTTEQHVTRERLAHTAFHDPLTGLPNRALFLDRLAHCTARARRNPQYRFAIAFVDIDDFKLINDSLGHQAGDALLRIVAERLAGAARAGDTVARMGGDEFTILFDPIDRAEDAESATRRLRAAIHGEVEVLGFRTRISTSVGIAMAQGDCMEPSDLLRDADTAMYHAKRLGAGRQQLFDQAMRASVVRRVAVEQELRNALEGTGGSLVVHYQPVIRFEDGSIEGFEALVRMYSASGSLISPAEFVPLAEAQGLIDAILDVVLTDACRMAKTWSSKYPDIYVSVNVSARSVTHALVARVASAIEAADIACERIKLELTESILVGTAKVVTETLAALRELGIGLYIDDFGTGFSSLSYLHQFPADRIKLDRSFVLALDGQRTPEIVETIVSLSRRIGAAVIAEGIETETQLRALRDLGCLSGQGYFFAPGVPAEVATQFIDSARAWPMPVRSPPSAAHPAIATT